MIIEALMIAGVSFGRNVVGIITRPYEAYRRIAEHGSLWELLYIGLVLTCYFALASLVKTAAFRPFLLTRQFVLLTGSALITYSVVVFLIWQIGRFVGGSGSIRAIVLGWGYSLIPTITWFLTTSLLYVLLPPPRTPSAAGVAFSVLFLVFSTTLLLWKFMLAYLTIRFGLHLDLARIAAVVAICTPLLAFYSMLMYRWGVFRVPFI